MEVCESGSELRNVCTPYSETPKVKKAMNGLDCLLHSDVRSWIPAEKESCDAYLGVFRLKYPSGKDSSHLVSEDETSQSKLETFTFFIITGRLRA